MWVALLVASIAALSIFGGMPLARARGLSERTRATLTSAAVGVLLYLFYDLLSAGHDAIQSTLAGGVPSGLLLAILFVLGVSAGAVGLPALVDRVQRHAGGQRMGPELGSAPPRFMAGRGRPTALGLSTMTAVAIGVHNFAEGLAVGAAFAGGLLALSVLLSIGVIAHKSVEGYCICGCAAEASRTYTPRQLAMLGAIGGGPVIVGAFVGSGVGSSTPILVAVYGLAIGAILTIVLQILGTGLLRVPRGWLVSGLLLGLLAAFSTDLALGAAGL